VDEAGAVIGIGKTYKIEFDPAKPIAHYRDTFASG
jgi:hypothetical protein